MSNNLNTLTDLAEVGSRNAVNEEATTYSETYFDALYQDNTDPWQYQTRWYEKRKRDMCLAVLPQAEYGRAIELGCGNGVFSELLARRCQSLLSIDGNKQAVQLAQQRLADLSHVRVIQGVIPNVLFTIDNEPVSDKPFALKAPFDLIVISEILYYLSVEDIDRVTAWIGQNLAVGGTLLCCHWRYDIEGFEMNGEKVHQRLYQAFNSTNKTDSNPLTFTHQSKIVDSDFLLDIWQHSSNTVAMSENLV